MIEKPRPPRPEEMEDLHHLTAICFGFPLDAARARERRRPRREPKGSRVIVADGKPISHIRMAYNYVSVHGAKVKVASFGGVCTHPDYRGRGIATQLLEACIQETAEAKAVLLIISGARGLYRRAHAVPAGPVWQTAVRPCSPVLQESAVCPDRVSVCRLGPEDWEAMALLHQAEPVRFVRTARFYAGALSAQHHRRIWLVGHEGRPTAYLCLSRIWGLPRDEPVRALGEYAGSRAALLDGLSAILAEAGLSEVRIAFPQFDGELAYLLRRGGLELRAGTIPGHTLRLLSLPGLMKALRPYLTARVSPADIRRLRFDQNKEICRFAFGGESADLDLSQAAALIFGGRRGPRLSSQLAAVLAPLFPIPVPLPGLNYV